MTNDDPRSTSREGARRVLTPDEVASRSKSNIRLAIILAFVAVAFFVSAWFIDIA